MNNDTLNELKEATRMLEEVAYEDIEVTRDGSIMRFILRKLHKIIAISETCSACNQAHDLECEECETEYLNKSSWEDSQKIK